MRRGCTQIRRCRVEPLEPRLMLDGHTLVDAGMLDLIEGQDDPLAQIVAALVRPGSGIAVVPDTLRFVGRVGDGENPDTAQSALFTSFVLTPNLPSLPIVASPSQGVFLTTGIANLPRTNEPGSGSFGADVPITNHPPRSEDEAFLRDLIGLSVGDINLFEFQFTVLAGTTSVEADFIFGSDEFPDQAGFTDIFAFVVDGVNYAIFPDGSLVSFVDETNEQNFISNQGNYPIEYDGISKRLHVSGLLDPTIAPGQPHTILVAIADTSDEFFDSGVFLGALSAGRSRNGGVTDPSIVVEVPPDIVVEPEPSPQQDTPLIPATDSADPLLLVITVEANVKTIGADYGTNGYIVAASTDNLPSAASAPAIDAALAGDEIDEAFLLSGFLDFVDPEMLVVDLGDEPPARVARESANSATEKADQPSEQAALAEDQIAAVAGAGGSSSPVEYLKPLADEAAHPSSFNLIRTAQSFASGNWRWMASTAAVLLLGGAAWKSRAAWLHAARKLWIR